MASNYFTVNAGTTANVSAAYTINTGRLSRNYSTIAPGAVSSVGFAPYYSTAVDRSPPLVETEEDRFDAMWESGEFDDGELTDWLDSLADKGAVPDSD